MRAARAILAVAAAASSTGAADTDVPRIVIAGDSTASAYPIERAPRAGWGMALADFFGTHREVRNRAISGRSARSFVEQGALDALAPDLRRGDVLLIQFGHNDEKIEDPARYNEPHEAFPRWLMRYVDVARARGAVPILITPLARRTFDGDQLLDTHGAWAEAVRALAAREGVALIDLTASSMDWLRALGPDASTHYYLHVPAQGLRDDTHLNAHGATAIACLVVAGWKQIDAALAEHVVRDTDCGATAGIRARQATQAHPSLVVRGDGNAREQPGPHGGAGTTTAYPYFEDASDLGLQFRKRVLPRGSGIGLHEHHADEIYTVLSGSGTYILDGRVHEVAAGDVMLTRNGSTHAIQQTGEEDLVLLIVYAKRMP